MKKSTVKAAKTPATKKAPVKIVKKPAVVKKAAAPAVKAPAKPASTVITAAIDIGFGNTLYIRGEGPGLSWDVGVPLECVADDKWSITLPGASRPVVYKVLVNDLSWSLGEDYVVAVGEKVLITPKF